MHRFRLDMAEWRQEASRIERRRHTTASALKPLSEYDRHACVDQISFRL